MDHLFKDSVMQASARPEVLAAVRGLYANLQMEIEARRPVCVASGRCCRFDEFGHRLFVTTLELAAFVDGLRKTSASSVSPCDGGCPFQVERLCSVHTIRPFGCRMFFCDPASTDWQNAAYERFHSELKRLHEQFDVPYHYLEWRRAIAELGLYARPLLAVAEPKR